MSYKSIAILKTTTSTSKKSHSDMFNYLIISSSGVHQFWDFDNNAIGAYFRRDTLQSRLEKQFSISFEEAEFKYIDEREYLDNENPPLTIFSVLINEKIKEKIKVHYAETENEINWLSFDEIKSKKEEWITYQKFIIENANQGSFVKQPPQFSNNFLSVIERIQDAQEEGKLVLFVGSGISNNSGVPIWNELIKKLKERADIPSYESDYLMISQMFYNEVGEVQYHRTIQKALLHKKVHPNVIHEEILKLEPSHIITTNYDDLIETAIQEDARSYSIVKEDKDLPFAKTPKYVVKMHGDFETKNIVLKEDDYLNYQQNFPLIENFVKGIFSSYTVVFLGFSFSDINLKYIIERIRSSLVGNFQPAILFSHDLPERITRQKFEYYKKRGIRVVNYEKEIKEYLNSIDEWSNTQLNYRGQRVFEFLRLIQKYDRFIEQDANIHIVDKMYNSLKRFDGFEAISTKTLEKLPPFAVYKKEKGWASFDEVGYHLQTKNEKIIEFVDGLSQENEHLKFLDKKFEFKDFLPSKYIDEKAKVYNLDEKLEYVLRKLNRSSINCLQRKDDNLSSNHYQISMPSKTDCECPKCQYFRLKFEGSLQSISNGELNCSSEKNEIHSLLNGAYANFQFGNFVESYEMLKKASLISLKKGWFGRYFVIQYNINHLKFPIKSLFNNTEIDKRYKYKILSEIDEVNLNKLLYELPLDDLVRKELEELLFKKSFHRIRRRIDKKLIEVENVFEIYKNGGNRMGYAPYYSLLYNFGVLYNYYRQNRLFDNYFIEFEDLVVKLWDATLFGFRTTGKEYNLSEIQYYLFDVAIFNIPPRRFKKLLKKHSNPDLNTTENDVNELIEKSENFFSSNHKETIVFKKEISPSNFFEIQKNKSRQFKRKCGNISGTILLLLAHTNLSNVSDDKITKLLNSILNFVNVEGKSILFDDEYLGVFIKRKISLFSEDLLYKILETILADNLWSDRLVKDFCDGLTNNKINFKISSNTLYEMIINRVTRRDKFNIRPKSIECLMPFLTSNLQKKFKRFLEKND